MRSQLPRVSVDHFEEEAHGSETVVARDHGRPRVFHPAVVKVATAVRERHDEHRHGVPCALAEPFGLFPAIGDIDAAFNHVAGVFDRVFVLLDEIGVTGFAHDGDSNLLHEVSLSRLGLGKGLRRYSAWRALLIRHFLPG